VLSPHHVRKTPASPAEDAELKASLKATGLKQNLIVCPAGASGFEVTGGGRRLRMLQELAAEGEIPVDYRVPCLIETSDAALETSLAENTIRAAMHPVDEFIAMAGLVDRGLPIEVIAARFGTSERQVRQRLRLGKLAPELLDALRAELIGLETMMAFTLSTDHDAQRAVWAQVKDHSYISPHAVRRLLTESAIPLDSDLGAFVGLAAYEQAGGRVTRDLFSSDDEGYLDDGALVRRLALQKLEAKAAALRGEWAWATAALDLEYGFLRQFDRLEPQAAELPPAVAAELRRMEQRLQELEALPEEQWTEALAEEQARLSASYEELLDSSEAEEVYTPADRAISGCIVTIGDDGEFRIYRGLVDRKAHEQAGTTALTDVDAGNAQGPVPAASRPRGLASSHPKSSPASSTA
jgi:ParB family chromosome partitioning protein